MINYFFISFSADSSNIWSFIYSLVIFTIYGYIVNSQHSQLPVGLIAQLVVHCTGIVEVMGSNPVQAWILYGLIIINNCIAKMEVGCLKYPGASTIGSQPLDWNNAPMTGTTAQPSHEPSHKRKGTGIRHTDRPRGRAGGEQNGRQNPSRRENWTRQGITWSMWPATEHARAKDRWPRYPGALGCYCIKLH